MPHGIMELGQHWLRWWLGAQSHCLNQYWLIVSEILSHSPQSVRGISKEVLKISVLRMIFRITNLWYYNHFSRGQWVKTVETKLSWCQKWIYRTCSVICQFCAFFYKIMIKILMLSDNLGVNDRPVLYLWIMLCFTHCSLMTPYGDVELGRHWLR